MSSTPRRCHADVGDAEGFTHGGLRIWAMGSLSAASLARQGARVAHVFVATFVKALCTRSPASPVRTAAVPDVLARPHVSSTSAPTVLPAAVHPAACPAFHAAVLASARSPSFIDETRPVRGGDGARGFNVESLGPVLHRLGAGRAERFCQGWLRWDGGGSHRLAVPCREQLPPH
jgi:hypothetical protein